MKTITYDETKYQLVPIEPTEEMIEGVCKIMLARLRHGGERNKGIEHGIQENWSAMLSAAPKPEVQNAAPTEKG